MTAQRILARSPSVIQIVPLTRTIRGHATEITIIADDHNDLAEDSAAQCQHIRAVATSRIIGAKGNVGSLTLAQIRDTLALPLIVTVWRSVSDSFERESASVARP